MRGKDRMGVAAAKGVSYGLSVMFVMALRSSTALAENVPQTTTDTSTPSAIAATADNSEPVGAQDAIITDPAPQAENTPQNTGLAPPADNNTSASAGLVDASTQPGSAPGADETTANGSSASQTATNDSSLTIGGQANAAGPGAPDNASSTSEANTSSSAPQGGATIIANGVDSSAVSGDASVAQSNTGGSATSGDSQAVANILNILASSTGATPTIFVANVTGNQSQNLHVDPGMGTPAAAGSPGPDAAFSAGSVQNNGQIVNDVALTAITGDATVSNSTNGGNATTGNAYADANIINIISSTIGSAHSFVGVINIYGTLTGNITLPAEFVNAMLTSSTPNSQGKGGASIANTWSIDNNVTASAASGTSQVANNGSAGNATTGSATTSVNIFNLTNSQVFGGNMLLVFVNVLGTWTGLLVNAPSGATQAAYANSSQPTQVVSQNGPAANVSNNYSITNNVSVSAVTGNALVTQNFIGGNATSGNALASVNILNIINSDFSLSNWFGVLFINVFGTWNGDFAFYSPPSNSQSDSGRPAAHVHASKPKTHKQVRSFSYVVAGVYGPSGQNLGGSLTYDSDHGQRTKPTQVLGTNSSSGGESAQQIKLATQSDKSSSAIAWLLGLITGVIVGAGPFIIKRMKALHKSE